MGQIKFESLRFRRASTRIEKSIKEAILDGQIGQGDRLPTEKQMAEQFGVSVVTLREALRSLEVYGLIEKKKGRGGGIFVSKVNNDSIKASLGQFLSFKDLSPEHIYEVRKIIEPSAIRLAVDKITPEEIKKLEENVCFCEEKLKNIRSHINKEDFFQIDKKCVDFHRIVAESTNNPILSLTIDYVFDFLPECETKILLPDINYSVNTVNDHVTLLDYLKKGDSENCEKMMIHHLEGLRDYIVDTRKS